MPALGNCGAKDWIPGWLRRAVLRIGPLPLGLRGGRELYFCVFFPPILRVSYSSSALLEPYSAWVNWFAWFSHLGADPGLVELEASTIQGAPFKKQKWKNILVCLFYKNIRLCEDIDQAASQTWERAMQKGDLEA